MNAVETTGLVRMDTLAQGAMAAMRDVKQSLAAQVRELVKFVLRQGDLGSQREFVGSDRAIAGIRGHQKIQRSRPTGYLTELYWEENRINDSENSI